MKKIVTLVLAVLMAMASLTAVGCGGGDNKELDSSKSQLYVGNFDAGLGDEWILKMAQKFEEDNAETVFETGKKGVQVFVDSQDTYAGLTFSEKIATNFNDVFFSEQVYYSDMVDAKLLLDISDVVTDTSAGTSIESRLTSYQKDFMNIGNKYYAIPYYQVLPTLVYNADLFEEEMLYLVEDKDNGNNGFMLSASDTKTAGPDGEPGTDDDGFPATYEELEALVDYMAYSKDIIPFIWAGGVPAYLGRISAAIAVAYDGEVATMSQATFNSGDELVEVVTGFEGDEPIFDSVKITDDNGYMTRQTAGLYHGNSFAEYILSDNNYYHENARNGSVSQLGAQKRFVLQEEFGESIAFFIEANYWQNEAKNYLEGDENYKVFPLPTPADNSKMLFVDTASSYALINAKTANDANKVKLAKQFLSYCFKLENIQDFNLITGSTMALQYELEAAQYEQLSPYQKSVYDIRLENGWLNVESRNPIYLKNQTIFSRVANTKYNATTIDGMDYHHLYSAIRDSGKTAKQYFMGRWIDEALWETNYLGN